MNMPSGISSVAICNLYTTVDSRGELSSTVILFMYFVLSRNSESERAGKSALIMFSGILYKYGVTLVSPAVSFVTLRTMQAGPIPRCCCGHVKRLHRVAPEAIGAARISSRSSSSSWAELLEFAVAAAANSTPRPRARERTHLSVRCGVGTASLCKRKRLAPGTWPCVRIPYARRVGGMGTWSVARLSLLLYY